MSFTIESTDFLKNLSPLWQNAGERSVQLKADHHPLWTKVTLVGLFLFLLRSDLANLHGGVDSKGKFNNLFNCHELRGIRCQVFSVRKAFLRRLKLSQKLVIANSLMEYNEQLYYNEKKSQKRLLRESYKN